MACVKHIVLSELDILRRVSVLETAGVYKERSYATAMKVIAGLPHLRSLNDVPPHANIGKDIRAKIATILTDGSLNIDADVRQKAAAMSVFLNIYGVGPKKAEDLINAGYRTLADLRSAVTKNKKLLNKNQQIGLVYYEQLLQRIPRAEMDRHAALLTAKLFAEGAKGTDGVIVGSYRRGASDSGDIDMLIRSDDATFSAFIAELKRCGYIREILAHGDHKCMAICQLPTEHIGDAPNPCRRLDLLLTPAHEFPFAVLYFTGCDTFNVAMRAHALTLGYSLNEHALTRVDTKTKEAVPGLLTEEAIFAFLGLQWVPPTQRLDASCVTKLVVGE